ncbi:MAG: hypothetical protein QF718_03140 [Phycisphaerales bacterium]|nr:hypothetical protein [Phycisphaerales bacterium]
MMQHWDQANEYWNDPVSKRIENKHIEPLVTSVNMAIGAMEAISEVIIRANNDCS